MLVIGLTGSIGMGKSTTAGMFRAHGVPVHDSDSTVHDLYRNEAVPLIEAQFPGVTADGVVDRQKLAPLVINDPDRMRALESIVHPLVRARERAFLACERKAGARLAAVDIPLLLETRDPHSFDAIVVVTAAPAVQRARVLSRPGMTEEMFLAILAKQMPDAEKRKRAHFVIDTGNGLLDAEGQVAGVLRALAAGQKGSDSHA